jgi:hypothetical protein
MEAECSLRTLVSTHKTTQRTVTSEYIIFFCTEVTYKQEIQSQYQRVQNALLWTPEIN